MRRHRVLFVAFALTLLAVAVVWDLAGPQRSDLRRFDADAVARLETEMWRAYYARQPVRLFFLLAETLRTQDGFPALRAHVAAFHAARAAFVFKRGRRREDYVGALPALTRYYAMICHLGRLSADPARLARLELDWWIVHRHHGRDRLDAPLARTVATADPELATAVADTAAALYGISREAALPYGTERAQAMRRRDIAAATKATESDWLAVGTSLRTAYRSLQRALDR